MGNTNLAISLTRDEISGMVADKIGAERWRLFPGLNNAISVDWAGDAMTVRYILEPGDDCAEAYIADAAGRRLREVLGVVAGFVYSPDIEVRSDSGDDWHRPSATASATIRVAIDLDADSRPMPRLVQVLSVSDGDLEGQLRRRANVVCTTIHAGSHIPGDKCLKRYDYDRKDGSGRVCCYIWGGQYSGDGTYEEAVVVDAPLPARLERVAYLERVVGAKSLTPPEEPR